MKIIVACFAAWSALATPVLAEEAPPTAEEGFDMLGEAARIILRSMLDGVEPTLDELRDRMDEAMAEMGPAIGRMIELMDDVKNYQAPEILPNGDIIIRRKPLSEQTQPVPGDQIEI
ncbi:MAG: hypothetical protein KDE03_10475 [Rhodobacteraceae bacterium]|nr:hypothetical protein [Paracoccaceae bacterium]